MNLRGSLLPIVCMLSLAAVGAGCGGTDVESVDPASRLCRGSSGVAARIAGTPEPVEMCVGNAEVSALLGVTDPDRYEIFASFTQDSLTIEIEISFLTHTGLPIPLAITASPAQICVIPDGVCFFYRETKLGEYDYSSSGVTGAFTLTLADRSIAVGTFAGLVIDLEDAGGNPTGSRTISEGFVSVTAD